jgi:hypothetical protein
MASPVVSAVEMECPLCGRAMRTTGPFADGGGAHLVALFKHGGGAEGFLLCAECGMLADFPAGITMN